jgi:hypothetical protein
MNLGDPHRQRNVTRKAKDQKRQAEADLKWLLAQPQGRRYLFALMQRCGIEQTALRGTSRETELRLGEQLLGYEIRNGIDRVDPAAYGQMRTEWMTEDRDDQRSTTESKPDGDDPGGDDPAS